MTEIVATYIARPQDADDLTAAVAMGGKYYGTARVEELAAGEAIDVVFRLEDDLPVLRRRLQAALSGLKVDLVMQPCAGRRKKLLIADMDSTVIGQECIDELADFAGFKPAAAAITERAMHGDLEFEPALHERLALLAGLETRVIKQVLEERITVNPGARDLIWTMRANGARTLLVSGGFTSFAEAVGKSVGFDEVRANRLLVAGGRLTGKVSEPILGPLAKLAALEEEIIRANLSADETMAVGDGVNDLPMIRRAGLGVAYHAKPKVALAADARIDHADLTALLYCQGYRRGDFVR